jgi:hypothetical protein
MSVEDACDEIIAARVVIKEICCQAEERYGFELADEASPDKLYEKRWALTVLDNVLNALPADYARNGQGELFETLQPLRLCA